MIFIKFLLISILIQNLIGCSTHNIKGCPDSNTINSETKFSKSLIKINIPEKAVIENNIYSKHSSGIHSAQFNDASLKLNMLDKDYIYSYKTSQLSVIERTTYQAYEGCYKDKFVRNEPIYDVKEPIGYEWRDTKSKHNILVSGFDKDYEFFTYGSMDLSFAILNSNLTGITELKITCVDCALSDYEQTSSEDKFTKFISVKHDFRSVKSILMESPKFHQYLIEKEDVTRKEEQKALELKAEKQKQRTSLDDFKIKCQSLGFKVGSKDFGDCVLELNDIK